MAVLCYTLRWHTSARAEPAIKPFLPISRFPLQHPKVTGRADGGDYCGQLSAGTRIPTIAQWPVGSNASCRNVSGAEAFYAYGFPLANSANTGNYIEGGTSVYMIYDEALRGYMIITSDKPGRAAAGQVVKSHRGVTPQLPMHTIA